MAIKQTETANKVVKTQKSDNVYILELKNITKTFLGGKIVANDNISLSFKRNEIHALVGENGSGKSTLMNILFGLYKQDKGDIFFNGEEVDMYKAGSAKEHKIGMVHQHFHLVEDFSVLENILLGQENVLMEKEVLDSLNKRIDTLKQKLNKFVPSEVQEFKNKIEQNREYKKELYEIEHNILKIKRISKGEKHNINTLNEKIMYISKYKNSVYVANEIEKLETHKTQLIKNIEIFSDEYEFSKGKKRKISDLVIELSALKQEENSFDMTALFGHIKYEKALNRFSKICKEYNINISADVKVSTLPVGQRQMVEILKVLWEEKDLIVFDEPTATLSVVEIKELLKTIFLLKEQGKTIIFISHKLQEVKKLADKVTILRKGHLVSTRVNDSSLKTSTISKEMVGKIIKINYPERDIPKETILSIKNISYITNKGFKSVNNVSFEVYKGEVFGLAGIEGNGQEEVLKIISGLRNPSEGEVTFKGIKIVKEKMYAMDQNLRRNMFSHIPIDRYKHAMIPTNDLEFNATLSDFDTSFFSEEKHFLTKEEKDEQNALFSKYDYEKKEIKEKRDLLMETQNTKAASNKIAHSFAKEKSKLKKKYSKLILKQERKYIKRLKYSSPSKLKISNFTDDIINSFNVEGALNHKVQIKNLSGGNQQKFIVGREILRDHQLLIAGHPTRGLDIAAIDMIYKEILNNSKDKATILYSLEIAELVSVCDRIAIMYRGVIVDIINPKKTPMNKISNMMIGIK